jgi:hypothetical protein
MTKPILPLPDSGHPETAGKTSGEGAQTALAAMIRKRKMGENHVEPELPEPSPQEAAPKS